MLSSGMQCYHLGLNVIIWDEMLSSGMICYHLEPMLSSGANVIIWVFSFGMKCYHLGLKVIIWDETVIIWDEILLSGMICYYLELILSFGT